MLIEKTFTFSPESHTFHVMQFEECTIESLGTSDEKIVFQDCLFDACKFMDCVMNNVTFLNCKFTDTCHFQDCSMDNATFRGCEIAARMGFLDCGMADAHFVDGCKFSRPISFKRCNLANAMIDVTNFTFDHDDISSLEKYIMIWGCSMHNDLLVGVSGLQMIATIDIDDDVAY